MIYFLLRTVEVAAFALLMLLAALSKAGGGYATFGNLLASPDGSGVKLSLGWKANVVESGHILKLDELRFPPRIGIGYTCQF